MVVIIATTLFIQWSIFNHSSRHTKQMSHIYEHGERGREVVVRASSHEQENNGAAQPRRSKCERLIKTGNENTGVRMVLLHVAFWWSEWRFFSHSWWRESEEKKKYSLLEWMSEGVCLVDSRGTLIVSSKRLMGSTVSVHFAWLQQEVQGASESESKREGLRGVKEHFSKKRYVIVGQRESTVVVWVLHKER